MEPGRWLVRRGLGGQGQGWDQPLQPFPVKELGLVLKTRRAEAGAVAREAEQLGALLLVSQELLCLLQTSLRATIYSWLHLGESSHAGSSAREERQLTTSQLPPVDRSEVTAQFWELEAETWGDHPRLACVSLKKQC